MNCVFKMTVHTSVASEFAALCLRMTTRPKSSVSVAASESSSCSLTSSPCAQSITGSRAGRRMESGGRAALLTPHGQGFGGDEAEPPVR